MPKPLPSTRIQPPKPLVDSQGEISREAIQSVRGLDQAYLRDTSGFRRLARRLTEEGYKLTDMQFNVGRMEGELSGSRGIDVINPATKERRYLTFNSDKIAEDLVRNALGKLSVFDRLESGDNYVLYEVPRGSTLLIKTLKAAPYRPEHLAVMAAQAERMINTIRDLDLGLFGLDRSSIAITHNGVADQPEPEVHLAFVPPFAAKGESAPSPSSLLNSDTTFNLSGIRI